MSWTLNCCQGVFILVDVLDSFLRRAFLFSLRVLSPSDSLFSCVPASSCSVLRRIFWKAIEARNTSSTHRNLQSSRSHAILTIELEQTDDAGHQICSKFRLVDLAGSESGGDASGKRQLTETKNINVSLLVLGLFLAVPRIFVWCQLYPFSLFCPVRLSTHLSQTRTRACLLMSLFLYLRTVCVCVCFCV